MYRILIIVYRKLCIAALAFAGASMFFSCSKNDISVVNNLTKTDSLPTQTVNNLTTIYADSSIVQVVVHAPLVKYFSENDEPLTEFPEGINVEFFNRLGTVESTLQANFAIYYEKKDLWVARDSVVAINLQKERLDAELLYWDINSERIYSDKAVKITTPDEIIYGEGFESDQAFNDWQISSVKGTVYISTEKENDETTRKKKE